MIDQAAKRIEDYRKNPDSYSQLHSSHNATSQDQTTQPAVVVENLDRSEYKSQ